MIQRATERALGQHMTLRKVLQLATEVRKHTDVPLLMMSYVSPTTNRYLRVDLDGFSLPEVSRLLPVRTWVRSGPLLHVHLHARAAGRSAGPPSGTDSHAADPKLHLVDSLRNSVERLPAPTWLSAWTNYYEETRFYTAEAAESKQAAVRELTSELRPAMAFDLGANTGLLAQLLAADGVTCIAFDRDAGCINRLYVEERRRPNSRILPLVMDLANPSPALGFGLNATLSLFDRPPADLVLCLALIHHLHFTERLPLLGATISKITRQPFSSRASASTTISASRSRSPARCAYSICLRGAHDMSG